MTQEEKQLLLKDLCARLAFGRVKCQVKVESFNEEMEDYTELFDDEIVFIEPGIYNAYLYNEGTDVDISDIKPYLRPMSSMTEEEKKEFHHVASLQRNYVGDGVFYTHWQMNDWLNKNMFDYRGLIQKGLAIEAPRDMYKTE